MIRGCFIVRIGGFVLSSIALGVLSNSASISVATALLAQLPQTAITPDLSSSPSSAPEESPILDRVGPFQRIASLKDEPRALWVKAIGPPAESVPPDKHSGGRDTWVVGDLKVTVKWGRSKSGLVADDIGIGATAGASELSLVEAKRIVTYFGLSNSWITSPNEKTPWYIWHDVDGRPLASYGPESARLVDGRLVPDNKSPALDIIIGHENGASRPGAGIADQALTPLAFVGSEMVQTRA